MYFTNCLLVQTTNIYSIPGNAFTNQLFIRTNDTGVFQTVGAGSHYLADDTYRGVGTTNVDPGLLADLEAKTTYPPATNFDVNVYITNDYTFYPQAQRDNSGGAVDIGYHYDPIDYAVNNAVSNATMTVSAGTVLAAKGSGNGLFFPSGNLRCSGTAISPVYIVRYNTVQEQ